MLKCIKLIFHQSGGFILKFVKINWDVFNPKNIWLKIKNRRKTIVFYISMFSLCISLIITVLVGLMERDGVNMIPTQAPIATASSTPIPTLEIENKYYISVNLPSEPLYLNSITAADGNTTSILRHMLEGLVRLNQSGEIIPGVAENWSSADNISWTFSLRSNSLWQDGSRVISSDFKATVDSHLSDISNSPYKTQMSMFASVDCPDENTITFTLNAPNTDFPRIMAQPQFFPIQKSIYDLNPASYGKEAKGLSYNGPWYVVDWTHGQRIVMQRNESYWNVANIALEKLLFMTAGTTTSKLMYFQAGYYDMVFLTPIETGKYTAEDFTVKNYPDGNVVYLNLNSSDPILANEDLRKALSLSIDRKAFTSNTLKNGAIPIEGYDITVDLPVAKTHLENASAALGEQLSNIIKISVDKPSTSDTDAESLTFATALATQLKNNLGLNIQVNPLSYAERIDEIKKGTDQITINSMQFDGTLPEFPLYYRYTSFATNNRIKNVISEKGRDIDCYFATPD